jgi:hypothetical protein
VRGIGAIGTGPDKIPTTGDVYDWVTGKGYISDGNFGWDNIYGFITDGNQGWNNEYGFIVDGNDSWDNLYGFITDGNSGWDNSYGFITTADLSGYLHQNGSVGMAGNLDFNNYDIDDLNRINFRDNGWGGSIDYDPTAEEMLFTGGYLPDFRWEGYNGYYYATIMQLSLNALASYDLYLTGYMRAANGYYTGSHAGVSGTFQSADGKTITVTGGIITGIN